MPHIHTEPGQFDFTASGYILRIDKDAPRLLMIRNRKLGLYFSTGGHVELDESPWDAVLKEINEEAGYTSAQLKVYQPPIKRLLNFSGSGATLHPQPFAMATYEIAATTQHFHVDIEYAFLVVGDPESAIADDESKDSRWMTLQEVNLLTEQETPVNVKEIAAYLLEEVVNTWNLVDADACR